MLTKWNVPVAVLMLSVTAMLWVFPALEAGFGDYRRGEQIVLGVIAAVLAVPFLWVCRRLPKVLRGMGVEIDAEGIHPFDGARTGTIGWHEIGAVGFGQYLGRYRGGVTRRLSGLEIYLMDAGYTADHPGLRGDWQEVPAPQPGLSAGCYRFTVSPYGDAARRVERAVQRFRPHVWRGPFTHQPRT
ncbi:hypothetical protein E4P42_05790 [Mycobacterium sp. PS03-16]|nr:hypothetical protein E4P42_05790 [Mycobacterium sp. PS03-16]